MSKGKSRSRARKARRDRCRASGNYDRKNYEGSEEAEGSD